MIALMSKAVNKLSLLTLGLIISIHTLAQGPYAPPAGQNGSKAIPMNSSSIIAWATGCTVNRGWIQSNDQSLGKASFGEEDNAIDMADPKVVSLGDGGTAILTFDLPIANNPGPDFAIFENGFSDDFLELAFVEVSSDGVQYFRFPAHSLTPTAIQIDGFGSLDATNINNLAGKYRARFGTPFDLEELKDEAGLDIQNITHIKLIDVVGSIDATLGSTDSKGQIINDPFPTPYASSGFDLDAVAVLNSLVSVEDQMPKTNIFPNPAQSVIRVQVAVPSIISLTNLNGSVVSTQNAVAGVIEFNLSGISTGIYFIRIENQFGTSIEKVVKQ